MTNRQLLQYLREAVVFLGAAALFMSIVALTLLIFLEIQLIGA